MRRLSTLVALVAVVLASACGGSGGQSGESGKSGESAAPAKPRETLSIIDRQVQLQKGQVVKIPFELRRSAEISVQAAHLSGDPIGVVFMNQKDLQTFEQNRELSYYTAMSDTGVSDRFDSGWQAVADAGVYTLVLWERSSIEAGKSSGSAVANVRVLGR